MNSQKTYPQELGVRNKADGGSEMSVLIPVGMFHTLSLPPPPLLRARFRVFEIT